MKCTFKRDSVASRLGKTDWNCTRYSILCRRPLGCPDSRERSDEQKANILAITLKNNFSENKRPGDGSHPIDKDITNTLENFFDNHPSIPISPTDPDEILNYIKTLKNNKAPGSDLITKKMVSNHGWHVSSSSPVPQETHRVGQRCTLNLSRAEMSSRWCGVVVRRGGASSGVALVI
ncbi:hypothetical protein TNCV_1939031 [Trichonephila clavipes]|nr:hypothetical protein TNCV_1939031 [Trichonephila clavipes]